MKRSSAEPRQELALPEPAAALVPASPKAGASATGLVFACIVCERRFARADHCPACGADAVRDLRVADDRHRVRRALAMPDLGTIVWPGSRWVLIAAGSLIAMGLVAGFGAMIFASLFLAALLFFRVVPAGTVPLRPFPPTLALDGPLRTVRGQVHVRRAVSSPSGTPCAAWQVVGAGPGGPLDDAGVGAFEVWDDGQLVATVDIADALVELGSLPDPAAVPISGALADMLRVRAPLLRGDRCSFAEGLLLEGDHVEVSGLATDVAIGDGLRAMEEIPSFQDWATIRKQPQG